MQYTSAFSILFISSLFLFSSCKDDDDATPEWAAGDKNELTLEFDNVVGSNDLTLSTSQYTKADGEKFTVAGLKYYISNISLKNADGTTYTVPQDSSYFLVDESVNGGGEVELKDIPAGNYVAVTYTIGVDSTRNLLVAADPSKAVGPLKLTAGGAGESMYWGNGKGYAFLVMDGKSPDITPSVSNPTGRFLWAVGHFGGTPASPTINNIRVKTLDLSGSKTVKVRKNIHPEVHIKVDLLKLFSGSENIKLARYPNIDQDSLVVSQKLATNYAGMFEVEHVHNDPQ